VEQLAQFAKWQSKAGKEFGTPEIEWDSEAQQKEAAQVLKKIHIMKAQQTENAAIKAEKERARQQALQDEEDRIARMKVCALTLGTMESVFARPTFHRLLVG